MMLILNGVGESNWDNR